MPAPLRAFLDRQRRLPSPTRHVSRWLGARAPGATMPITTLSELAHAWWDDQLSADWQPYTREQNQAILDSLGLVGNFWRLP